MKQKIGSQCLDGSDHDVQHMTGFWAIFVCLKCRQELDGDTNEEVFDPPLRKSSDNTTPERSLWNLD